MRLWASSARTAARELERLVGLLTVSETARILGVSPSTLRLWENAGLISPARSNGRYRLSSLPETSSALTAVICHRSPTFPIALTTEVRVRARDGPVGAAAH
jgi:transposase-like protein